MAIDKGPAKLAIQSKTIIGGVLAVLPALSEFSNELAGLPLIPPHIAAIVSGIGGLLAIVGRFAAKVPVNLF